MDTERKYLGININKVKYHYNNKNFKSWKRFMKTLENGKTPHTHGLAELMPK